MPIVVLDPKTAPFQPGDKVIYRPAQEVCTVVRCYECEGGWGNVLVKDRDGGLHTVNNWQLTRFEQ